MGIKNLKGKMPVFSPLSFPVLWKVASYVSRYHSINRRPDSGPWNVIGSPGELAAPCV